MCTFNRTGCDSVEIYPDWVKFSRMKSARLFLMWSGKSRHLLNCQCTGACWTTGYRNYSASGFTVAWRFVKLFWSGRQCFHQCIQKTSQRRKLWNKIEYVGSPSLDNRILILSDPMLATGSSIVATYKALMERGTPKHTHIVSVLASTQGVEYVKTHMSENVTIWCSAIDEELTSQSYIVPGLGDAGI